MEGAREYRNNENAAKQGGPTNSRAEPEKVVRCLQHYMEMGGARVSRAEFEANLAHKLADPVFHADVAPLLALRVNPEVAFEVVRAAEAVHRSFISRISGEPWKGRCE